MFGFTSFWTNIFINNLNNITLFVYVCVCELIFFLKMVTSLCLSLSIS